LDLVGNGNVAFLVDAVTVLETNIPFVDRLVSRRAPSDERISDAEPCEARSSRR